MDQKIFLNFDLMLEGSEGDYLARVLDSPAGQDKNQFGSLFQPEQLNSLLERISQADGDAARELGKGLFDTICDARLQGLLNRSLDEAERLEKGLRIRLRLSDVPELINLPWEYLYDPAFQRFFALSADTPIVRFLDLPERERDLAVTPPLRVLVMLSSPNDYPYLDVEAEWNRLKQALAPLEQKGLLLVERLDQATLPMLHQRLRQNNYHIFHFIGHGATDENKKTGTLVFETEQGSGNFVDSQQLNTLLFDEKSLRLVVLNACQGAQTWASNPFGGVAQGLVQQGVPAVVAMQFPVSDRAAIAFSQGFYSALADYYPVDAAMGEARKAMFLEGNAVEWATPVLYLRASSAYIFGIPEQNIKAVEASPILGPAKMQPEHASTEQQVDTSHQDRIQVQTSNFQKDNENQSQAVSADIILPGKWLIVNDLQEELTIEFTLSEPSNNAGKFSASLYYKRSKGWADEAIDGKWVYDPAKNRLSMSGSFVDYGDRFSLTLMIGLGKAGFFNAKDSKSTRYTLTRVTSEFQPIGKWLIRYEMNGPSELSIEFSPSVLENPTGGDFTATENYRASKRWYAEDVTGQWNYDPAKKRLALSGKYAESGNRFSITPYINRWERNHFSAKDHDGIEFLLVRVG